MVDLSLPPCRIPVRAFAATCLLHTACLACLTPHPARLLCCIPSPSHCCPPLCLPSSVAEDLALNIHFVFVPYICTHTPPWLRFSAWTQSTRRRTGSGTLPATTALPGPALPFTFLPIQNNSCIQSGRRCNWRHISVLPAVAAWRRVC